MSYKRYVHTSFDWGRSKDPHLSLSAANIIANVQHITDVRHARFCVNIDHAHDLNPESIASQILQHVDENDASSTLIGISTYVWSEKLVSKVVKEIRDNFKFDGDLVLGGPQITYCHPRKDGQLDQLYPGVNAFLRGYCESDLISIIQSGQLVPSEKTPGLWVANADVDDEYRMANASLDTLKSPWLTGLSPPNPFMRWETQRGCAFRCSFCQHRAADGALPSHQAKKQFPRLRVLREAEWLCDQNANGLVNDVAVVDPIFNSGPNYMEILNCLIDGRYSGKIAFQARLEMVREPFLDAIEQLLSIGATPVLEFGIQSIHKSEGQVVNRINNMKRVESNLAKLNERGIPYELSFIYGLPTQTKQSFFETMEWADIQLKQSKGHSVARAFPLMILRGTPLADFGHMFGIVESDSLGVDITNRVGSGIPHVVASDSFTFDDWLQMHEVAEGFNCIDSLSVN
eukprot:TRINITY_DN748_c0_g1_i10.p1 TRINITY_DN748_c0_g1~~TRINITY_DN748_c0_g1_i10.p1  ORF type:complete len:459 (-),score=50.14 TRINITY_DN748_c0_g1_i10:32-1408(-)